MRSAGKSTLLKQYEDRIKTLEGSLGKKTLETELLKN